MRVKAVSIMGKKRETMCMAKQKESFMDATWLNERNKALGSSSKPPSLSDGGSSFV